MRAYRYLQCDDALQEDLMADAYNILLYNAADDVDCNRFVTTARLDKNEGLHYTTLGDTTYVTSTHISEWLWMIACDMGYRRYVGEDPMRSTHLDGLGSVGAMPTRPTYVDADEVCLVRNGRIYHIRLGRIPNTAVFTASVDGTRYVGHESAVRAAILHGCGGYVL